MLGVRVSPPAPEISTIYRELNFFTKNLENTEFTWRVSDCEELVPNFILNGTKVGQFSNIKEMNYM